MRQWMTLFEDKSWWDEDPEWWDSEEWPKPDDSEETFLGGSCETLACALHDRTGWPIVTNQAHTWVVRPDGRAVDIRGVHDTDKAPLGDADAGNPVRTYSVSRDECMRIDPNNLGWSYWMLKHYPEHFGIEN